MRNTMKFARLTVAALFTASLTQGAWATTIVMDDFTATDTSGANTAVGSFASGKGFIGRTPDGADLPGTTWLKNGASTGTMNISGNEALIGNDDAAVINLISYQSTLQTDHYVNLSATLNFNGTGTTDDGFPTRGLTLGFWDTGNVNTTSTSSKDRNGSGVVWEPADGVIRLVYHGATVASTAGIYMGTGSSGDNTLSYSLDVLTGQVYNVVFDSTPVTFSTSFLNGGTLGGTDLNFIGVSALSGANKFDNFTLTTTSAPATPEPASLAILAVGSFGLLRRRRSV